jgi:hypothetical protein
MGKDKHSAKEGDLILCDIGPAEGPQKLRFARVLGLATHDGCGKKYRKPRLAVLLADDFFNHAFEAHIDREWVLRIRDLGDFSRWFFFGKMPPIETAYAAGRYGILSDDYIAKYLINGHELRADWREVAEKGMLG